MPAMQAFVSCISRGWLLLTRLHVRSAKDMCSHAMRDIWKFLARDLCMIRMRYQKFCMQGRTSACLFTYLR